MCASNLGRVVTSRDGVQVVSLRPLARSHNGRHQGRAAACELIGTTHSSIPTGLEFDGSRIRFRNSFRFLFDFVKPKKIVMLGMGKAQSQQTQDSNRNGVGPGKTIV